MAQVSVRPAPGTWTSTSPIRHWRGAPHGSSGRPQECRLGTVEESSGHRGGGDGAHPVSGGGPHRR